MVDAFEHRFGHRLFEWATSFMMLCMAMIVAFFPQTAHREGLFLLGNVGLTAPVLAVLFCSVGFVRFVALFANGWWPTWGPYLRASCALVGASIWGQMMLANASWEAHIHGTASLNTPVFLTLMFGELISCYRAAKDVRRYP